MKARQLEVFCMIMRHGTVTAAARALHISQPALSQILAHAEDELGFKLFERRKGRLVATPEAHELYPQTDELFAKLQALRRKTADMRHGRAGAVQLVTSAPPALSFVPQALVRFRANHPEITIRSHVAPLKNVVDMLRDGDAAVGVAMSDVHEVGIDMEKLGDVELVCVFPRGHEFSQHEAIGFEYLSGQTLISYRRDTLPAERLVEVATAEGFTFSPNVEIDVSLSAIAFVQEGLGVAVVDGLLPWANFPAVEVRPFLPQIALPITMLTSNDHPMSTANELLRTHLRDASSNLPNMGDANRGK